MRLLQDKRPLNAPSSVGLWLQTICESGEYDRQAPDRLTYWSMLFGPTPTCDRREETVGSPVIRSFNLNWDIISFRSEERVEQHNARCEGRHTDGEGPHNPIDCNPDHRLVVHDLNSDAEVRLLTKADNLLS